MEGVLLFFVSIISSFSIPSSTGLLEKCMLSLGEVTTPRLKALLSELFHPVISDGEFSNIIIAKDPLSDSIYYCFKHIIQSRKNPIHEPY